MSSNYDEYLDRRTLWAECLGSDDEHGLWKQIWHATWNATAYRIVNKAVELAPEATEGGRELNGMLFNLLRESFFEAECVRIRRLVEVEPHGLDKGVRSVFSVGTLLKDIEDHAHLLTPDNIVRATEERGAAKWWSGRQREHAETLLSYGGPTQAHIPSTFLVDVRHRMRAATRGVSDYVDKYIAHAATPMSRAAVAQSGPNFLEVMSALRAIHETAEFASIYLLDGASHGHLPIAVHDQLAYLDRPLVPDDSVLTELRRCWEQTEKEVEQWQVDLEGMLKGLEPGK